MYFKDGGLCHIGNKWEEILFLSCILCFALKLAFAATMADFLYIKNTFLKAYVS